MDYIQIIKGPLIKNDKGEDIPGSNKYGFKFNQEAVELFLTEVLLANDTLSRVKYASVYAGLVANQRVKRLDKVWTWEDACDFADTLTLDESESVINCMNESTKYKEFLERMKVPLHGDQPTDEIEKKNTPVTESENTGSESTSST